MNLYPYTDFHELNDDWIIGHIKKNEKDIAALQNTIVNLNFEFDRKADKATTYTKTEVNSLLSGKVDNATLANYYDKTETDNLLSVKADSSSLATVATSGSYNDLLNKPTIPAAQVNSDWNASSGVAEILNKPTLATVATSGDYNDLNNKPKTVNYVTKTVSGITVNSSDYYKVLGNAITDFNVPSNAYILAVTMMSFTGVSNTPVVLGIDGSAVVWMTGLGHTITNATLNVRIAYLS